MNIDERLEALVRRHEALSQTVELIAAAQRDNEARIAAIGEAHRANEALMNEILTALAVSHSRNEEFKAQTKVFSDRTQAFMDRTEVMLDRLSNIVITHDERARRPLAPP